MNDSKDKATPLKESKKVYKEKLEEYNKIIAMCKDLLQKLINDPAYCLTKEELEKINTANEEMHKLLVKQVINNAKRKPTNRLLCN